METKTGAGGEPQPYDKETGRYGYDSRKSYTIDRAAKKTVATKRKPFSRVVKYISYDKVGIENVRGLKQQLYDLYEGMEEGIANGVALSIEDTVFIADTGISKGEISFGIRKMKKFSDKHLREEYIRRTNNDSISKGYISDGLSSRLGN